MSVLLRVENLRAGYSQPGLEVIAARDISFELGEGEFLGLAGESGCGKTTLAYAIAGLLQYPGKVFGGKVEFNGKTLRALSEAEMRKVRWKEMSIVMQASMNVLNPVMRVRHQFYDVMRTHSERNDPAVFEQTALEMFRLVGISPEYLDAYPHQLSGGMKQRVVIAMALALRPKLVILDEPTTALDVVIQRSILQQIDQLRRKLGFSIIMITHDLSLLVEIADSIAVMYAGYIVEKAPAEELYQNPQHPYTKGLMRSFPPLVGKRQRMQGIPGQPPNLAALGPGCPFHPRCPQVIKGICDVHMPLLKEVKRDHYAACQLYADSGIKPAG